MSVCISVDAMGGDYAPDIILEGVIKFVRAYPDVSFLLFGTEEKLQNIPLDVKNRVYVIDTQDVVGMDEKPSQAIRRTRKTSSMWQCIEAVASNKANVAVSGGNTGALMAMAKIILKTVRGIQRPAIAAIWPTMEGNYTTILDVGATTDVDSVQMVQFAAMGAAYAKLRFKLLQPRVGLLNVGQEDIKGTESLKEAVKILRDIHLPIDFKGFVEGDDIGKGVVDVVVTDGFSGNIALKVAEGTVRQIFHTLKRETECSWIARIGLFLAYRSLRRVKNRIHPSMLNGGVFLGLHGTVIKSHGSSTAGGFFAALRLAFILAKGNLAQNVREDLLSVDDILSGLLVSH